MIRWIDLPSLSVDVGLRFDSVNGPLLGVMAVAGAIAIARERDTRARGVIGLALAGTALGLLAGGCVVLLAAFTLVSVAFAWLTALRGDRLHAAVASTGLLAVHRIGDAALLLILVGQVATGSVSGFGTGHPMALIAVAALSRLWLPREDRVLLLHGATHLLLGFVLVLRTLPAIPATALQLAAAAIVLVAAWRPAMIPRPALPGQLAELLVAGPWHAMRTSRTGLPRACVTCIHRLLERGVQSEAPLESQALWTMIGLGIFVTWVVVGLL